ncbi:putative aspartic protease At2g35615 [Curcuma longa]|uniref:putative aspartic protease At2g35615 n=1 Tax=Curcuma longa TaxID=136217 RepID=UPI003D9E4087
MAAIITFLLLLLLISFAALVTAGTVFDVELVHRDSPKSPLYNSSLTPFDRLQAAALRSVDRASYLATRIAVKTSLDIDLGLRYDSEFLMGFSMGTPNPQPVWGIVDTGSDLNWVNCVGCQCFNRSATLFNASASLSYKTVTCYSDECSSLGRGFCTEDETCQYHYAYGDGSNIDGLLSTDTFRFHSATIKPIHLHSKYGIRLQLPVLVHRRRRPRQPHRAGPPAAVADPPARP